MCGREDVEPVDRRGVLAGDRGGARLGGGETRGFGVARHGDAWHGGQMAREPLHALRERLRVRIDLASPRPARARSTSRFCCDAQLDLAADRKRRLAHEIERAADGAFGRILDRHDRVVGLPAFGRAEHVVDRRERLGVDELTEMLRHRRVRERARPDRDRRCAAAARARGTPTSSGGRRRRPLRSTADRGSAACSARSTCASRSGR